jgi:tartrate/fumarate subfamily iron-sulfur-dependent hydro-lyase alpha chain
MKELRIERKTLFELMRNTAIQAARVLPKDVVEALLKITRGEKEELARLHLLTTMDNIEVAEKEHGLACADTGYPLFYIKIGNNVSFEGGVTSIYDLAKESIAEITLEAKLRPNMVHPLTRANPGNNIGYYMPKCELRFDEKLDGIEITYVPKGGGSEVFGSFFRMMAPADGKEGIIKFVFDCAERATYSGKVCPPAVFGIGIGGTSDTCMKIAKEAAVLRLIGARHPDPEIAQLEDELLVGINSLGIGSMGFRGAVAALDVHIELAATHPAALPVAFTSQCSICRRSTVKLGSDGVPDYNVPDPGWNYR